MLSLKELQVIYRVINLACSFGCIPCDFLYSKANMELDLRVTRSKFKLVFCFFNFIVSIFYLVYTVIRVHQVYRGLVTEEFVAEDLAISFFYLICRITHVISNLTFARNGKEFSLLVKRQSELNSQMGKEF